MKNSYLSFIAFTVLSFNLAAQGILSPFFPDEIGQYIQDIDVLSESTFYAAGRNAIFFSSDKGETLEPIPFPFHDGSITQIEILSNGTLIAGGNSVYISDDQGNNWSEWGGSRILDLTTSDDQIFLINNSRELYRSNDNGLEFTLINPDVDKSISHMAFLDDGFGIVVDSDFKLHQTDDYGETWTQIPQSTFSEAPDFLYLENIDEWYLILDRKLFKSIDQGTTWQIEVEDSNQLRKIYPFNDLLLGITVGDLDYNDNGAWRTYLDDFDNREMSDMEGMGDILYAVGLGSIYRKDSIWHDLTPGTNDHYSKVSIEGNNIGLYGNGPVYLSQDAGQNFEYVNRLGFRGMDKTSFQDDIMYVGQGSFRKSVDFGQNWTVSAGIVDYHLFEDGTLYGISSSAFMISTDQAETWQTISEQQISSIQSMFFLDKQNGWVCSFGNIRRTRDGGQTWTEVMTSGSDPRIVHFHDPMNGVGKNSYNSVVLTTNDGGDSWQNHVMHPDNIFVNEFYFENDQNGYAACESNAHNAGYLLHTNDGGTTWTELHRGYDSFKGITEDDGKIYVTGWSGQFLTYEKCDNLTPELTLNGNVLSCNTMAESYVWYLDDYVYAETTSFNIEATEIGTYTVRVKTAEGCTSDASAEFLFDIDEDQDGYGEAVDCDDTNPDINPGATEIPNNDIDEDCDGEALVIDNDGDGFNSDQDCDDENFFVNPDAIEVPNNTIDEDCDGVILIIDEDGDGWNSDEDCDDNNPDINPDATEIVNNDIDEDCDGVVNVIDEDNDGFNSDEDCDDMNALINPDATEIVNNMIDEDCDGVAQMIDADNDGFNSDEDCDDTNAAINPDATEIPNNEVDEDCDGNLLYLDEDQDGYTADEDCDDNNLNINPGATEVPNNNIDEDCDGEFLVIDEDNDGFNSDEDCDDTNALINPDATEIPNNTIDEDCDGEALIIDNDGDGYNSDEDCDDTNPNINPGATDIPDNGIDEDCDGVDSTEIVDQDNDGFGSDVDCDDSNAEVNPDAAEICDGIDNNCDGNIDEGLDFVVYYVDADMDGFGDETNFTEECMQPAGTSLISGDCDDSDPSINPDAEDIPNNGIDEDCDGQDMISSLTDIESSLKVNISPNPVSQFIKIDIDSDAQVDLTIYSSNGHVVLIQRNFDQQKTLNVESLIPGIYIIKIQSESRVSVTQMVKL